MAQERHLIFAGGMIDVEIQIEPDQQTDTLVVRGQVTAPDPQPSDAQPSDLEGIEVSLTLDGNVERRTVTDEFGRFQLSSLKPGAYSLQIIMEEHDIILQPLKIQC